MFLLKVFLLIGFMYFFSLFPFPNQIRTTQVLNVKYVILKGQPCMIFSLTNACLSKYLLLWIITMREREDDDVDEDFVYVVLCFFFV